PAVAVTLSNDTTPPVISGVASSSVTTSGATVAWTTNEASDSQVDYGTTTAYGSSSALNTSLVTSHSVVLTGLTGTTAYHYRVKSHDAAGNLATSGDFTFTTVDGTAPTRSEERRVGNERSSGTATSRETTTHRV